LANSPHWDPDSYLEQIRVDVPRFEELQRAAIEAIPFEPKRVLELGMGTGETTRYLLERFPDAWVIGLDSNPNMVYRLREEYDDVQLARMEDPLPDGPWDLVISVLSVHYLPAAAKQNLFRRAKQHSRALVIGDIVEEPDPAARESKVNPSTEFVDSAEQLAEWAGGEVTWSAGDVAVISAVYD
jgi:tRNA (cmo5U34)-methyltransferase